MITSKTKHFTVTILLIAAAYLAAHVCFWLLPNLFETWGRKVIDRLFLFRTSSPHFQPRYNETVVHVDITDTSLQRLGTFYLNRFHYARVIQNLGRMNVSAQMYDFIFAARSDHEEDRAMIDATREAGNVYIGQFRGHHTYFLDSIVVGDRIRRCEAEIGRYPDAKSLARLPARYKL